jgi:gamma-polyglutamate biosynthesis protein CapA
VFKGKPSHAELLKRAGFTTVNIANNHITQHGERGFWETVTALSSQNLTTVGMSTDVDYTSLPYITLVKDIKIAFVGYSLVPEGYHSNSVLYASPALHNILDDIARLKDRVDVLIVSVHAGSEGLILPDPDIIRDYHTMADAGANIILGHHSHVFQPVERYKNSIIFYSLGDFIFDLFWDAKLVKSAIAKIEITRGGDLHYDLIPTVLTRDYQVKLIPENENKTFLAHINAAARYLNKNSREYETIFKNMLSLQRKKLFLQKVSYFFLHFLKGETLLKLSFLYNKIYQQLKKSNKNKK